MTPLQSNTPVPAADDEQPGAGPPVEELLRQRQTVQGWLDRLGEHGDEISPRVLDRVRTDYQGRLEQVLEALSSHQAALHVELDRQRTELQDAQARLERALDELEEGRLRQLIGELSDEAWSERRPRLEEAVEEARAEQDRARAETERLEEILAQLDDQAMAASPAEPAAGESAPEAPVELLEQEDADPWDPLPAENATVEEPSPAAWQPAGEATVEEHPRVSEEEVGDGLEFLEELDRAIASSPEEDEPRAPAGPPVPGVKCGECGYTNDATAWYCGVCGADLA